MEERTDTRLLNGIDWAEEYQAVKIAMFKLNLMAWPRGYDHGQYMKARRVARRFGRPNLVSDHNQILINKTATIMNIEPYTYEWENRKSSMNFWISTKKCFTLHRKQKEQTSWMTKLNTVDATTDSTFVRDFNNNASKTPEKYLVSRSSVQF